MKLIWSINLTLIVLCFRVFSFGQCTTTIYDEPFNTSAITGANAAVIYGNGGSNHNASFALSGTYFGWFNIQNGVGPVDVYDITTAGLSPGCTVDASIWIRESYGGTNVTISLIDDNNVTIATQTLNLTGVYQQITLSATATTPGVRYLIHFNGVGGNGLDIACEDLLITQTCVVTSDIAAQVDQCLNGNSFTFDGTGTTGDLPITSYTWDYGDGSPTGTGSTSTHTYVSDGTFTVTLTASDGSCTDQTTINVTVHPSPIADAPADVTSCGDYTLPALTNGNYFTASGGVGPIAVGTVISTTQTLFIYAESSTIPNCTEENSFTITINTEQYGTDLQSACGSFTWIDGNTYNTNNNTATHTLVGGAANGCDSVVTIDLTILQPSNGVDIQSSCGSFTWIDGNTYNTNNNTATHTVVGGAANGCDSIVTLDLTILAPAQGTDIQTSCPPFVWIDGNSYSTSNNTATHTITGGAANGCDSIVTLDLTIAGAIPGTDTQTACETFSWIDGNTYTSSNNTATHLIPGGSASGCDSIVTLNLTIIQPTTTIVDTTVCSGTNYTFADQTNHANILQDQTHTSTLAGTNGCDSIIIENVTVTPPDSIYLGLDMSACLGETITISVVGSTGTPAWNNGSTGNSIDVTILSDTFFVAEVNSSCGTAIDTIFINTYPPFTVDAGPDQTIPLGSSATLEGSGAITYIWSPSTFVDCDTCQTTITTTTGTTTYLLTGTNENGCTATDTVVITIDGEINIYIPNVFSPNNDGENDVFKIYGAEWKEYKMEIYNRFGGIIFSSESSSVNWDGKHHKNDNDCQQGVYIYRFWGVTTIGFTYERAGNVMLTR